MTTADIKVEDKVWDWLSKAKTDVIIDLIKSRTASITYIRTTETLDIYVNVFAEINPDHILRRDLVGCIRRGSNFKFDVANPNQSDGVLEEVRKIVAKLFESVERNIESDANGMNYDYYNDLN